ncbi:MAG: DUF1156 domain-containing protein, partial [Nitrospirae bacterium]|nr:DUF1156 domain-containing protein [Nitrospirota bacterium]
MTVMIQSNNSADHSLTNYLIETDSFPIEFISNIAKRESWRKELYRPIYHIHKWWAKRLGSVFRGIILGSLLHENDNLEKAYYQKNVYPMSLLQKENRRTLKTSTL